MGREIAIEQMCDNINVSILLTEYPMIDGIVDALR
nr:MAG TPA: hypothetical protein [Caudoviricetes sp.]